MRSLWLLVSACCLGMAASTGAQGGTPMRFGGMDRNHEGVITRGEWRGSDRSFRNHDWNGHGVLSGHEVRPGAQRATRRDDRDIEDAIERQDDRTEARFRGLDHDGDGRLNHKEWHANMELYTRVDRNHDGYISLAAFLGDPTTDEDREDRFADLDTNRDGRLTRDEWDGSARVFQALDANRDGVLTRAEAVGTEGQARDEFSSIDANGDGVISRDEWHWNRAAFDRLDVSRGGRGSRAEFDAPPAVDLSRQSAAYRAGFKRGRPEGAQAGREDKPRHRDLERRAARAGDGGLRIRAAHGPPRRIPGGLAPDSGSATAKASDRAKLRGVPRLQIVTVATLLTVATAPLLSQNTPSDRVGGPAQTLTADDVLAVLTVAASALDSRAMAAAVVDRTGSILGVYARPDADERTPDIAVSLARAGALFANDQAPLSSRTVRFISGSHFPPGIRNTPNAALYGVENINRGCRVDEAGDAVFNALLPRPTSIAGTFGDGTAGSTALPCEPADTRGCARGGPMLDDRAEPLSSVGITTGKADVLDSGQADPATVPVNPGGIPIYRGGKVIGGIGVAGVSPELAEYAATLASAGAGRGMDFSEPLGAPGAVFIDGLRLPFFGTCTNITCIRNALKRRPAGTAPGRFSDGRLIVQPRDGLQAPEGYVLGPRASSVSGGLTVDEVRRIIDQAVAVSLRTRAQIRLPISQPVRMVMGVSDETGRLLAVYRMADATVFSADVAMTKARNAFYFSTPEGNDVLRSYVENNPYDDYRWEPAPPSGRAWAITARTLNFGGQPLFPPGIDLEEPLAQRNDHPRPGPWFDLYVYDSQNPCTEGPGPSRGSNRSYLNQSGIVWFAGSAPLYRDGRLIGGFGVSGDGVEQDDYVSQVGSEGFHPPDDLRVDRSVIRTGKGKIVRLPYLKFPRNPEIQR